MMVDRDGSAGGDDVSTSEAGQATDPPREERVLPRQAAHVRGYMEDTQERVRQALVDVPQLCHIGHFADGDWDFSYEVEPVRTDYAALGCNLIGALTKLDEDLDPAGTGQLIRTVVHAEDGALICDTIVPGERLLGVVRQPQSNRSLRNEVVRHADAAIAKLIENLMRSAGQGSENHGGYDFTRLELDPLTWQLPPQTGEPGQLADAVLDPEDLQYVAVVRDDEIVMHRDVFDHPAARRFFRAKHTPERRRRFYREFVPRLGFYSRRITGLTNAAIGGGLHRLVLDVRWGAMYFYRIDLRTYLVGITLNQEAVVVSDLKTEWLRESLVRSGTG
jgi:hypothetical protein